MRKASFWALAKLDFLGVLRRARATIHCSLSSIIRCLSCYMSGEPNLFLSNSSISAYLWVQWWLVFAGLCHWRMDQSWLSLLVICLLLMTDCLTLYSHRISCKPYRWSCGCSPFLQCHAFHCRRAKSWLLSTYRSICILHFGCMHSLLFFSWLVCQILLLQWGDIRILFNKAKLLFFKHLHASFLRREVIASFACRLILALSSCFLAVLYIFLCDFAKFYFLFNWCVKMVIAHQTDIRRHLLRMVAQSFDFAAKTA